MTRVRKRICLLLTALGMLAIGYLPDDDRHMPVDGATPRSWHPQSFWYHPWGASGVHKGIDIFAVKGTTVRSSSRGIVVYRGRLSRGGNVVLVLGPKWRLHYYAHLQRTDVGGLSWLSAGERIGSVGDSGNALGKPPHLHYSIRRLIPAPLLIRRGPQGWRRMFYEDPSIRLAQPTQAASRRQG